MHLYPKLPHVSNSYYQCNCNTVQQALMYNNNNNLDHFNDAVTRTQPIQGCRTRGSSDKWRGSAKWLPTFKLSQPTSAVSPPVGCYDLHSASPLLLLLNPKYDTNFTVTRRVEGWVNLGLHCTWVWEICPWFLHGTDLAGSRISHLRCASPTVYQ